MIKKVFFDFDGVVVDSEPLHAESKALTLQHYGINYTPDLFDRFKGITEMGFFRHVSERLDPFHRSCDEFIAKRHEFLARMLPEMPFIEGYEEFMDSLHTAGIEAVLVTSSTRTELANIDKYLHFTESYEHIIAADDTKLHKPYPDPYLKALEIVNTKDIVVIEDSPNGILAAKRAGCMVYALLTSFPVSELEAAGADMIFEDYKSLRASFSF
ncbi:MAG: HAD family phosphatase [Bacteroidales bacterium]|nr:HAD family phosphatase [Bacteroidales bacterium]